MNKTYTKNEYYDQWLNSRKDENGEIDHLKMLAQLHAAIEQYTIHDCESSKRILEYGANFVGCYLQDLYQTTDVDEKDLYDHN